MLYVFLAELTYYSVCSMMKWQKGSDIMDRSMSNKDNKRVYNCYFELTLDIIGGKWKPIILYYIGESKVIRYGDLRRCIPKISERMLTRQLRELESDGLVHREVYKEVPPRVEYSLTELGDTIMPIMYQLKQWGIDYNQKTDIAVFEICPITDELNE